MFLKRCRRNVRADRTFERGAHSVGFVGADGEKQQSAGFADRRYSLRERCGWRRCARSEEALVGESGLVAQAHQPCAAAERRAGLVERYVSVSPDSQELQVDAASRRDRRLVALTLPDGVACVALQDVHGVRCEVHTAEYAVTQRRAERLRIVRRQTGVLVEREGPSASEGHACSITAPYQLVIQSGHRVASSEAQDRLRVPREQAFDDVGRGLSHVDRRLIHHDTTARPRPQEPDAAPVGDLAKHAVQASPAADERDRRGDSRQASTRDVIAVTPLASQNTVVMAHSVDCAPVMNATRSPFVTSATSTSAVLRP